MNTKNIDLQQIIISWTEIKPLTDVPNVIKHIKTDNRELIISGEYIKPEPYLFENNKWLVCVFGTPIINDKINPEKVLDNIKLSKYSEIDGEFLIIILYKVTETLKIINDRFTSIPLYYRNDKNNGFIASYSFFDLMKSLKKNNNFEINHFAFMQVLLFRRVLDIETLDKSTYFLAAASIIELRDNKLNVENYWKPKFEKNKNSVNTNAKLFVKYLKNSINKKTSDNKRYGLFLSGGMDTRTILAAFSKEITCFTATYRKDKNREFEVSRQLANAKDATHIHLQIPENHFSDILEAAIKQSGGMYQANSIFMGFKSIIEKEVDVAFHGHGFDYMFQGMYLPAYRYKFFGKPLIATKLSKFNSDLVTEFIERVPYKVKLDNIFDYIDNQSGREFKSKLKIKLNALIKRVSRFTDDQYDKYEYLTFHYLSRHYSFSDHAGIHTNVEQRTVAFDNAIYDLYHSLPHKQRFDGRVMRKALKKLNKKLFNIKTANRNLPIASSKIQTLYYFKDLLLKVIRLKKREEYLLEHHKRTWPTHEWIIKNEPYINEIARNIKDSCIFDELYWLNKPKILNDLYSWLKQTQDYTIRKNKVFGDFIWTLITFDQLFKLTK